MQLSSVGLTLSNIQSVLSVSIWTSESFYLVARLLARWVSRHPEDGHFLKKSVLIIFHIGWPFFKFWLKALLVAHCHHSQSWGFHVSARSVYCLCSVVRVKHLIVPFRTDFRSSYIMNSTIAGIEASDTNLTWSNSYRLQESILLRLGSLDLIRIL